MGEILECDPHCLSVVVKESPLSFNINDRYGYKPALTPVVRAAIKSMYDTTRKKIQDRKDTDCPYTPNRGYFDVRLVLKFGNERGDIDNPVKRIIDAVFDGIRHEFVDSEVHDGRIRELHVKKFNVMKDGGTPSVSVEVRKWRPSDS